MQEYVVEYAIHVEGKASVLASNAQEAKERLLVDSTLRELIAYADTVDVDVLDGEPG